MLLQQAVQQTQDGWIWLGAHRSDSFNNDAICDTFWLWTRSHICCNTRRFSCPYISKVHPTTLSLTLGLFPSSIRLSAIHISWFAAWFRSQNYTLQPSARRSATSFRLHWHSGRLVWALCREAKQRADEIGPGVEALTSADPVTSATHRRAGDKRGRILFFFLPLWVSLTSFRLQNNNAFLRYFLCFWR